MTAIDVICAKLDEIGVEHETYDLPNGEHGVSWIGVNGIEWEAVQRFKNLEIHALQLVTPKQAIAATVGAGTCQIYTTESWLPAERYHRCKHCGAFFAVLDAIRDIPPRVCPNCGRRIEVDE